jgi:hypothetical protein
VSNAAERVREEVFLFFFDVRSEIEVREYAVRLSVSRLNPPRVEADRANDYLWWNTEDFTNEFFAVNQYDKLFRVDCAEKFFVTVENTVQEILRKTLS